jgi:hypothetical protein
VSSLAEGNLLTENAALRDRLRRLSPLLPAMAADLASTRREANRLRRENARLLAHIDNGAAGLTAPLGPVLCEGCGAAPSAELPVGVR